MIGFQTGVNKKRRPINSLLFRHQLLTNSNYTLFQNTDKAQKLSDHSYI